MPKLLKQVWKTFFGSFFETEEEAARAEIHWKADAAITTAWKAAMAPIEAEDAEIASDARRRRERYGEVVVIPPYRAGRYNMPPTFQAELLKALEKEGVMAEPKLSTVAA